MHFFGRGSIFVEAEVRKRALYGTVEECGAKSFLKVQIALSLMLFRYRASKQQQFAAGFSLIWKQTNK